jgi:hypothetical protein
MKSPRVSKRRSAGAGISTEASEASKKVLAKQHGHRIATCSSVISRSACLVSSRAVAAEWYRPKPSMVLDSLKEDALFVDGINGSQTSDVGKGVARKRYKIR